MRRTDLLSLTCLALLAWAATGEAQGQTPAARPGTVPTSPPPISPYLNLLRRGTIPAVNYYGLVRPQVEFRNSLQHLQQQVSEVAAPAAEAEAGPPLPATGHPVQFMNHARYFQNLGSRTTLSRAPTTAAPISTAPRAPTAPRARGR